MRTLWLTAVCAVALTVCVSPVIAAVNVGGYAKIDNYVGYWENYPAHEGDVSGTQEGFHNWEWLWYESNTDAISIAVKNRIGFLPPSEDSSQNCLYFNLSGSALMGDYAWTPTDYRIGGQSYYRVSFDWTTNFSSGGEYLRLDIWFWSVPGSIWSVMPGSGLQTGHVDIMMPDVEDVVFRVTVVPEPNSMTALAILAGGGSLLRRRKR